MTRVYYKNAVLSVFAEENRAIIASFTGEHSCIMMLHQRSPLSVGHMTVEHIDATGRRI